MSLGHFGGRGAVIRHVAGGTGGSPMSDLAQVARDAQVPSPEGMPAIPGQLFLPSAGYARNLLVNGDMEQYSSGTTSAPDGWTLTGAGASVARNTTNVQRGLASVNLTNAASTAADLGQALTISSTQNTHLQGRTVTLLVRVKCSTASRAFVKLDDGVNTASSDYHDGDGAWRDLFVSLTIASTATKIEASLELTAGAAITATFDAAMLAESSGPVGFSPNFVDEFLPLRTVSATGDTTINSGTYADLASMSLANVILNGRQSVLLFLNARLYAAVANDVAADIQFLRDSTVVGIEYRQISNNNGTIAELVQCTVIDRKPAAGVYTYKVQWKNTGAYVTTAESRILNLMIYADV